jgi:hypothetical protein
MDYREMGCVDVVSIGLLSCPVVCFGISGVEPSGSVCELVS